MIRLGLTLALVAVLAGCVPGGPGSGAREAATYQCVPSDAASPGGAGGQKSRRLTVTYDARGQQALLSLDGGNVNYLPLVPDVKDRLYANAKYAWKSSGNANLLTDIAEVQVYSCTRSANAGAVAASTAVRP